MRELEPESCVHYCRGMMCSYLKLRALKTHLDLSRPATRRSCLPRHALIPDALDRAFAACDNRAVPSFGRDYVQRNRAELAGMIRLAQGSKALAGFQRFGAYERLKSVYVQRWALKRRFAAAAD